MEKWIEFELGRINKGLVVRKKRLRDLLKEESPKCVTRDGEEYWFDKEVLRRIKTVAESEDLMLPMTLHSSMGSPDSCYIADELAAYVLRHLERFGEAYPFRDGKMWLPNSLAYGLLQKYSTAIQWLFL